MKKNLHSIFWVFFLSIVIFWEPAFAQNADTAFDQKQIELLQRDSSDAHEEAVKLRRQAEQYRELAESAEHYAAGAADVKTGEEWQKTAREHREKAEKLEQKAAQIEENASETQDRINDVQSQIETKETAARERQEKYDSEAAQIAEREAAKQKAIDENPNTGLRVGNVIGLWRDKAHEDEPFIIVQKDPNSKAYPNKLQAHTPRRVWEGNFHTDPPPGEPLITMSYKPKAEEMNPEIPEWARRKIEGELEWKLEINGGGTCGTPALSVDFYPGEVKWKEKEGWGFGKGNVSIEGQGEARRMNLHQSVSDMRFYSYGSARLYLRPPGLPQEKTDDEAAAMGDFNEYVDTVDALVHGQRFFVDVVLPYEEAEKQGEKLTVQIKAAGGDSTSIELQRSSLRKGRSAVYTHYDPITIADPLDMNEEDRNPPLLSIDYILGYQGARIDLDVENAELVTFSYGEALQTVPVFNSWVQRGINQHQEAIERLRPFYSLVLADGTKTKGQKEEATDRLTMIANYEHIMESDKIHDFIRYKVGEAYFSESSGITGMNGEEIQREAELTQSYHPLGADRDGNLNRTGIYRGVVWTSRYEMNRIENTVVQARINYRETALKEIPLAMTFALYSTVMGMSGFGDVYTLRTGEDIFGKKVPGWQRIMAAVGIASSNLLSFTAPHVMTPPTMQGYNPAQLSGRAMRSGANMRLKTHEHIAAKFGAQKLEAAMNKMNAEQVNSIAPAAGQPKDVVLSERPMACAGAQARHRNPGTEAAAHPSANTSAPPPHPTPLDPKILDIKKMLGPNTEVVNPGADSILPPQEFETCQCASTQLGMKEDLGFALSEMSQFGLLVRKGHIKPGTNDMPLANGYSDAQLSAFLKETGAEVLPMPSRGGRPLTLEALDVWMSRGWRVRDVIKTIDTGEPHAIELRKLIRNENGDISDVQWFDPAFGKELKTPVCDYMNKLAFDGYDGILYRWKAKEGAPDLMETAAAQTKPTIEYPTAPPKPSIEHPAQRNPSAARNNEVQLSVSEHKMAEVTAEAKRLSDHIDRMYPDGKAPPISAISRDRLKEMFVNRIWEQPVLGGASFSIKKIGTLRNEVIAIRIRPESRKYIEFRDHTGGNVPMFWPSGKIGQGKVKSYIPTEHLEWIDADHPTWQPFPQKGEADGAFNVPAPRQPDVNATPGNSPSPPTVEEFDPTAE